MQGRRAVLFGAIALVVVAIVGVGVFASGASQNKTESNAWGCQFGGGALDTKGIKKTIPPGERGGWSVFDTMVEIPSDVRFYIIDSDPNTADFGGRPIEVPARGSAAEGVGVVNVQLETQVRFTFNENVCDWYVEHGKRSEPLRYDAEGSQESGWAEFLNTSMNQKLIEAARPEVAGYSYIDLYVNSAAGEEGRIYERLATAISTNLSRELQRDLGKQYFCGPSYEFDGDADGELGSGCPDLEVTVKRVFPTNVELVTKLETIVANEEEAKVVESTKERQLAQTRADQEVQTADQERRQAVEVAQADADLAIARAEQAVLDQVLLNQTVKAKADAAYCAELAAVGVDCALLKAAEEGSYPRIVLDGSSGASILVDAGQ